MFVGIQRPSENVLGTSKINLNYLNYLNSGGSRMTTTWLWNTKRNTLGTTILALLFLFNQSTFRLGMVLGMVRVYFCVDCQKLSTYSAMRFPVLVQSFHASAGAPKLSMDNMDHCWFPFA